MTVVGTDIPQGQEVKWFIGGVQKTETKTVTAGDVTAGYLALAKKAEYGSVIITVNGVVTACLEKTAAGAAAASETTGTNTISYTNMTAADEVVMYYLDIETTPLTQVAACKDVKTSISADEKSTAIHGQANKIKVIGAIEQEAELEELHYNQSFIAACIGDQVTGSPATGMSKLTTKYSGMKKIGAMVGKRYNTSGAITYKWILYGAQVKGIDKDFPTDDMYKDSIKVSVDDYLEIDLEA